MYYNKEQENMNTKYYSVVRYPIIDPKYIRGKNT